MRLLTTEFEALLLFESLPVMASNRPPEIPPEPTPNSTRPPPRGWQGSGRSPELRDGACPGGRRAWWSESGSFSRGPSLGDFRRRPGEGLREQDTQLEEHDQRERLEDHRHRIHARQGGGNDRADEVRVATVLAELLGAGDAQ